MNNRIRMLRETLNMTRAAFGERIGVSGDVINNIERGRVDAKEHIIKLLCLEFNVNDSWLRDGTGDMFVKLDRSSEIEKRLSEILADSSDSFKKRFIELMLKLNEEEWQWIADKAYELIAQRTNEELPEPDPVVAAEDEYIKSRSASAQNTEPSATGTI